VTVSPIKHKASDAFNFVLLYVLAYNGLQVGVVRIFGEVYVVKANAYLEIRTSNLPKCPHNVQAAVIASGIASVVISCEVRISFLSSL